jgi:ubiquinone/menaquinone biosynthesis C-methylase UbiE
MSTLADRTAKKYRGRMAANYEAKRMKQQRWDLENQIVAAMLHTLHGTVLDVPVGTGRYLELYQKFKLDCTGIDTSEEMLALAKQKNLPGKLLIGDATAINFPTKSFDHVVCIRFLDLIDEPAMYRVMKELCRVAKRTVIFTIRLGKKYILKVNTATHNARKLKAYVEKQGWLIAEEQPIFQKGWYVIRLRRDNGWISTRTLEYSKSE